MKKLALICGAILASINIYAQGTVTCANSASSLVINSLTGAAVVTGSTFQVALYYLPDTGTPPTSAEFDAAGTQLGANANFAPIAGRYSIGTRTTPATTAPGGSAYFQVRAWETAFGSTYGAAVAAPAQGGRQALAGTSNIMQVSTGNPTTTPPGSPTVLPVEGFTLTVVPEPAAIGLGLLGIGALLLLRRRK